MGSGADGDFHETTLEREARELRESRRSLKLGATYQHYKTKGKYVPLQLLKFEPEEVPGTFIHQLRMVTFTGDGEFEDARVCLSYSLKTGRIFLWTASSLHMEQQKDAVQVLYYAQAVTGYFVRPLSEFVARVTPAGFDGKQIVKAEGWTVPRFELVEG